MNLIAPADESTPSADDVRRQLARIVESGEFTSRPKLQAFLEFVVAETLAGRGNRIKGFTVGHAVYRETVEADPDNSTIVRVEAGRLRRRLASYYQTSGAEDPVRITVPKGTYTPVFAWKNEEPELSSTEISYKQGRKKTAIAVSLTIATVLLFVMAYGNLNPAQNAMPVTDPTPGPNRPYIAVLPMEPVSGDADEERLASGFVESMITDLSKISTVSVMAHTSTLEMAERPFEFDQLRTEYGATHILRGSLEKSAAVLRMNLQLVDTATSQIVWAERFDGVIGNTLQMQDRISNHLAVALSDHFDNSDHVLLARHHKVDPETLALFRQALEITMPPSQPERIRTARDVFRQVTTRDPDFAGGYAGLSFTHSILVFFVASADPAAEIATALEFADTAMEKNPQSGIAHGARAFALALDGRVNEGKDAGSHAVHVQPGDAFTRWLAGMTFLVADDPHTAAEHFQETIRLDPLAPRMPYLNALGVSYFAMKEYELARNALELNIRRGGPVGPPVNLFRAAVFAKLGESEKAAELIGQLPEHHQNLPIREWLAHVVPTSSEVERTLDALRSVGLDSRI